MFLKSSPIATVVASLLVSYCNGIENGDVATPDYPWMTSVQRQGRNRCGGTLVDVQWVLTTEACLNDISSSTSGRILVKQYNVRGNEEDGSKARNIIEEETVTQDGLAMLRLNNPINPVPPIPLSSDALSMDDQIAIIGWGDSVQDEEFSEDSQPLRAGVLTVLTDDNGETFTGGSDTYAGCDGDEGGPAIISDGSGGYIQVGIITGYSGCNGTTEEPELTYFKSSASFKTWVEETITPPTAAPTEFPTPDPTGSPTVAVPTAFPTTTGPTTFPSKVPTSSPSGPTAFPTSPPSPSSAPTNFPTGAPVTIPPTPPTGSPTQFPTLSPSKAPSMTPSASPTLQPTISPISLADWQDLQDACREADGQESRCLQLEGCEYLEDVLVCRTTVERPPDPPTARPTSLR